MAINNRDRQRTRVVFVPVTTGGGGSQAKIKVGENGIKLGSSTFTEVPQILDFSDVTDMRYMFQSCYNLTTIPEIDTSNVTDMRYMFQSCYNLTNISEIDTSNVTDMEGIFYYCQSLTTVPKMNTSQVTNVHYMFSDCRTLTSIPTLDISNVTDMYNMFYGCSSLTTIPEMNTSNVIGTYNAFGGCTSLTDLGGFIGLKCNLDLSASSLITHESIMNVINKAADVTASPATLTLGSTNLAKLTDEEKSIATNKGWTLA